MHSDLKPDGLTMPGKELEFPIALLSHLIPESRHSKINDLQLLPAHSGRPEKFDERQKTTHIGHSDLKYQELFRALCRLISLRKLVQQHLMLAGDSVNQRGLCMITQTYTPRLTGIESASMGLNCNGSDLT